MVTVTLMIQLCYFSNILCIESIFMIYSFKEVNEMIKSNPIKAVENVVATMAIEDMRPSNDFIVELLRIATGEKTSEDVRQEILKQYAGH